MTDKGAASDREVAWGWLAGAVILAGVARLAVLSKPSLWLDEIYSATLSMLSLGELLVAVIRFDSHPPLYYLQLWAWSFVSATDSWLLLNSTSWSVASVLLTGVVGCRLFGRNVGVIAALLLAASPISIHYSQELRNYSLLMVLSIASWYRQQIYLERGENGPLLQTAALQAAICLSHAAGPFMSVMIASAGFAQLVVDRQWSKLRPWLVAEFGVGLVAVPVVANSMVRRITIATAPDASDVFAAFGKLIAGLGIPVSPALQTIGAVGMALVWVGAYLAGRRYVGVLVLVLGTFVVAFGISHILKPIWYFRTFVFLVPFFALSLSVLTVRVANVDAATASSRVTFSVASAFAALVATLSITLLEPPPPHQNYRGAAAVISSMAQAGDGLVVDPRAPYWGMARYLAGPYWGSPLEVQPLRPYDDRWHDVLAKIPASVRSVAGLDPKTDFIEAGPLTMIIGTVDSERGHVDRARVAEFSRLWVVMLKGDGTRTINKAVQESLDLDVIDRFEARGLTIYLLERPH